MQSIIIYVSKRTIYQKIPSTKRLHGNPPIRSDNDRSILKFRIKNDKTKTESFESLRASTVRSRFFFFENLYKLRLINSKSKSMENAFEMRVFTIQIFQLCPRIYAISSHNGIKSIDVNEHNFLCDEKGPFRY